ncbi:MAG: tRNA (guanosine(37)-N1)-methyltransferase TrmD [Victivallales bacterium]|nr:tRNA (guanosine(37)-N1)-methyltransferase TrmD [Victivallales bacterium]MCF7889546.1 tRNA (guanosine(37)-N1)-methyltransferase TrmD [Victivallales bacterium]
MQIDIITIFPNIFFGPLSESIIGRARKKKLVNIDTVDLREFTTDRHRSVDDTPYGGGPGMLMKPEPLFKAVEERKKKDSYVILTSPQGEVFNQKTAVELSCKKHLVFVCGHYEGVDERVRENLIDRELSIGDYVLTSGNLAAMVIIDSVVRLIPGVLGSGLSAEDESFSEGLLEYPQYTKPSDFRGLKVPEVLMSGNHKLIEEWKKRKAEERTRFRRPDLYEKYLENNEIN